MLQDGRVPSLPRRPDGPDEPVVSRGNPQGSGTPIQDRADPVDASLPVEARRAAGALKVATRVLAVPSAMVAGAATVAFVAHMVLAVVTLADRSRPIGWIWLGLAVAGLVVVARFLIQLVRTLQASRDPAALATDLIALVDIEAITEPMIANLAELTSREGGIRGVSRARALWRVLRGLDITEHVASFSRARWFVPPDVTQIWGYAQSVTWGGLAAWILLPVTVAARAAGWI